MKEEFSEYLQRIGITDAFFRRIETVYEFYEETCPDEIADVFVTEYITEEETREYESLWFFSSKYCMEAKGFVTRDEFDIAPIRNRVNRWEIRKRDYDFKAAGRDSRLDVTMQLDNDIHGRLKASRENCDYLRDIFLRYVAPNLKE